MDTPHTTQDSNAALWVNGVAVRLKVTRYNESDVRAEIVSPGTQGLIRAVRCVPAVGDRARARAYCAIRSTCPAAEGPRATQHHCRAAVQLGQH